MCRSDRPGGLYSHTPRTGGAFANLRALVMRFAALMPSQAARALLDRVYALEHTPEPLGIPGFRGHRMSMSIRRD